MFSGTNLSLYSNGLHKNTLQGRGADNKKEQWWAMV